VRVGVRRAHTESVNVQLARPATLTEVRTLLASAPGVELVDDRATQTFPTPLAASDRDPVLVGRIRGDESMPAEGQGDARRFTAFDLFCSGDQIRKGAALNAVQIGDMVMSSF
ncbi:MAG: Asd/ArgC dimerization domain-containing protein, partial [Planctomycetota bacterium]